MQRILVIQTAFIGDVVLATGVLEKLHQFYPESYIDILVRKGNESLFNEHPFLHQVLIWNKQISKYKNLFKVLKKIRENQYELVINLQRFAATGFLTAFSGAKSKIGFDKNPFSFLFTEKIKHIIGDTKNQIHEIHRNHSLIALLTDDIVAKPVLYPTESDKKAIEQYISPQSFICLAPASVWFTKQFPEHKWVEFLNALPEEYAVYLLGAPNDKALCDRLINASPQQHIQNLCGKLGFLASAALMQKAVMNYVNDSAPLHFASAVNAPVTAVYCSTLPSFGFGPLSTKSWVVENKEKLSCRPCGLHGKKTIQVEQLLDTIKL
jgi:heptosyltransferase II